MEWEQIAALIENKEPETDEDVARWIAANVSGEGFQLMTICKYKVLREEGINPKDALEQTNYEMIEYYEELTNNKKP